MSKIFKLSRKHLNLEKYDSTIQNSINYRIYAESWYLDLLTRKNWECLIYGDYEAVMPLPIRRKLGLKLISQPTFCQQLGIFSTIPISKTNFEEFITKMNKLRIESYSFCEENSSHFEFGGKHKSNFILNLSRNYDEIYSNYSKSTKWNLKQFEKSNLEIVEIDNTQEIIEFNKSLKIITPKSLKNLSNLLLELKERKILVTQGVKKEDNLIGFGCFILSKNRIIYINAGATDYGKKLGVPTGILNQIIEKNSSSNCILDFEGSSIPTLYKFFKRFGTVEKNYVGFSNFNWT